MVGWATPSRQVEGVRNPGGLVPIMEEEDEWQMGRCSSCGDSNSYWSVVVKRGLCWKIDQLSSQLSSSSCAVVGDQKNMITNTSSLWGWGGRGSNKDTPEILRVWLKCLVRRTLRQIQDILLGLHFPWNHGAVGCSHWRKSRLPGPGCGWKQKRTFEHLNREIMMFADPKIQFQVVCFYSTFFACFYYKAKFV